MPANNDHQKKFQKYFETLKVKSGKAISLKKDFHTDFDNKWLSKEEGLAILDQSMKNLAMMQDELYASNKHSVLIILQAMDAAGKDGAVKHVLGGLNPNGVKVCSFKVPSSKELEHDYLWRHYIELPPRGEIAIFNRSHYENVLVTRVHPEYILNENLPSVKSVKDIDNKFWQKRFKQINHFEKTLADNGTTILKFFLHVSKEEQRRRFLERIDDPQKNWKFSIGDVAERQLWDDYQHAYEQMLPATSTGHAPWYVLPADDKWFTRFCLGSIIFSEFEKLGLSYPKVSDAQREALQKVRVQLMEEDMKKPAKKKGQYEISGKQAF